MVIWKTTKQMQHSQNIICNDKETRTVHRLPPPPTLHLVTAAQWRHQPQVADSVDIQILDISTQWCSELSLECPIIRLYSQSPVHHRHDILLQMGCSVLYCTALYCPVPGESQLDGFLCWLLPVSPCTVTIHSSSTSLALDYVITLPTTTTTQGAGGDILPPHRAQEVIYYPAQTPPHLIFVFNPSTTFKHFITIYIKCVLLPMKQNIIIRPRPLIPCSYLPLSCKHKAHKSKCDY